VVCAATIGWCAAPQQESAQPAPGAAQIVRLLRIGQYEAAHQAAQSPLAARPHDVSFSLSMALR